MCCLSSCYSKPVLEKEDITQWSHQELKQIKKGNISLISNEGRIFKITCEKSSNTFQAQEQLSCYESIKILLCCNSSALEEPLTSPASEIGDALNRCENRDILSQQDARNYPLNAGSLQNLLRNSPNTRNSSISIVHDGQETVWVPGTGGTIPEGALEAHSNSLSQSSSITRVPPQLSNPQPQRILIYGFKENRISLRNSLSSDFGLNNRQGVALEFIDDYNRCLPFTENIKFSTFCDFLDEGRKSQITLKKSLPSAIRNTASRWAGFLQNNIERFDFSRKVSDEKSFRSFVCKNCSATDLPPVLTASLKDQNSWKQFCQKLRPAWDLLKGLNQSSDLSTLKGDYERLLPPTSTSSSIIGTGGPSMRDLLDTIIGNAFFRQSCKLGLTFARTEKIPVILAFQLQEGDGSIKSIQDALDAKKYQGEVPNNPGSFFERITHSEFRELERLIQKGEAPDYLLISKTNGEGFNPREISINPNEQIRNPLQNSSLQNSFAEEEKDYC